MSDAWLQFVAGLLGSLTGVLGAFAVVRFSNQIREDDTARRILREFISSLEQRIDQADHWLSWSRGQNTLESGGSASMSPLSQLDSPNVDLSAISDRAFLYLNRADALLRAFGESAAQICHASAVRREVPLSETQLRALRDELVELTESTKTDLLAALRDISDEHDRLLRPAVLRSWRKRMPLGEQKNTRAAMREEAAKKALIAKRTVEELVERTRPSTSGLPAANGL